MKHGSFRKAPLLIIAMLASLGFLPLAHASTYIGYGSSNCSSPCGNTGWTLNYGVGETIQSPFAGTLVSVGFYTGSGPSLPGRIIILTTAASVTGFTCCGGEGAITDNTFSFTVQDNEVLSGLSATSFLTVNLASPVTVTNGQFVAIVFTGSCNASFCLSVENSNPQPSTLGTCFSFGSQNPALQSSFTALTTGGSVDINCNGLSSTIVGASFNPSASTGGTVTVTQCYGNCGNPPITLVNTNSTHTVNFNQSITLFYEFQSNLNGFLLNVTVNVAKSYANSPTGPAFGVYTIPSCPLGVTPFSVQCPGLLQQQSALQNFFSPAKGRVSFSGLKVPVSNGQWVGIALSAVFSGFDVNDTNTNVGLFQTNEGKIPPSIQQPQFLGNSKVGLWSWIVGNVVSGNGPSAPGGQFNCAGLLDCLLPNWVNSFCSNPTTTCTSISGMIWGGMLAIFFTFFTLKGWGEMSFAGNAKLPIVDVFLFWGIIWMLAMGGLSLSFTWIPLFFFFVVALMFGKHGTFL